MNRRTLDILVPIIYALAIAVAFVIGDPGGVGGVALIGAVCVAAYYAAIRHSIRTRPNDYPPRPDPPGHTSPAPPGLHYDGGA